MILSPNRRFFPLVLQLLAVIVVAAIFVSLGLWQWDRAQRHQELERELDQIAAMTPVEINSILKPVEPLDGGIANRLITAQGRYLRFFTAPQQEGVSYQVGLFEVAGSSPRAAILVARQMDSAAEAPSPENRIEILARILPTQREDRIANPSSEDQLRRIDSALLVDRIDDPSLALYDGFLLVREEQIDSSSSSLALIPDQIAEPTIPGYYWQHISYVVIWLLMAALVLYLPFYQRRRNRLLSSQDGARDESDEEKREEGVKR